MYVFVFYILYLTVNKVKIVTIVQELCYFSLNSGKASSRLAKNFTHCPIHDVRERRRVTCQYSYSGSTSTAAPAVQPQVQLTPSLSIFPVTSCHEQLVFTSSFPECQNWSRWSNGGSTQVNSHRVPQNQGSEQRLGSPCRRPQLRHRRGPRWRTYTSPWRVLATSASGIVCIPWLVLVAPWNASTTSLGAGVVEQYVPVVVILADSRGGWRGFASPVPACDPCEPFWPSWLWNEVNNIVMLSFSPRVPCDAVLFPSLPRSGSGTT